MTEITRKRYALKDVGGGTIWYITKGRATVGHVVACGPESPGAFLARVGREKAYGVTPIAAFEKVTGKVLEFESKEAPSRHAAAARAKARAALKAGDFEAFFELTTKLGR